MLKKNDIFEVINSLYLKIRIVEFFVFLKFAYKNEFNNKIVINKMNIELLCDFGDSIILKQTISGPSLGKLKKIKKEKQNVS